MEGKIMSNERRNQSGADFLGKMLAEVLGSKMPVDECEKSHDAPKREMIPTEERMKINCKITDINSIIGVIFHAVYVALASEIDRTLRKNPLAQAMNGDLLSCVQHVANLMKVAAVNYNKVNNKLELNSISTLKCILPFVKSIEPSTTLYEEALNKMIQLSKDENNFKKIKLHDFVKAAEALDKKLTDGINQDNVELMSEKALITFLFED
jgi:hypothetical protein